MAVKNGAAFVQKREYDGLRRRTVKEANTNADGTLDETRHYFYNEDWQVIEERVGPDPVTARVDAQYVWNPEYVDSLALRYWDHDAAGGPSVYHYLESPKRGIMRITALGRQLLGENPSSIDVASLKARYPALLEWVKASQAKEESESAEVDQTPDERLEAAYQDLVQQVAVELLDSLKGACPRIQTPLPPNDLAQQPRHEELHVRSDL